MNLKSTPLLRCIGLAIALSGASYAVAQTTSTKTTIEKTPYTLEQMFEPEDYGYIAKTFNTQAGIIAASDRGNEIFLVKDGTTTTMVSGPGAGVLIHVSPDGRYVGYKDINLATEQAPAILDVVTGQSRRLENYVDLCGQPAFVGNNAVCYTIGSKLVVRNLDGSDRREYPMPEYANTVSVNPAGTIAAFGTHDGAFYLMSLADGSVTRIPELDGGYNPQWSDDGTQIAMLCESGSLLTYDINARKRCNLGYANDFCWADNSKTLVYSSVRLSADEQILGASVIASAWDGSQSVKLVNETTDLPTAVLCSGNTLLTSYAMSGDRALRKTAIRRSANGIAAAPGRTVQMLSFAKGQKIGKRDAYNFDPAKSGIIEVVDETAEALSAKAVIFKGNSIGLTAVPYINQNYDVGNETVGGGSCGPSSGCMNLAYRKLLPSSMTPAKCVLNAYTAPKTGTAINKTATYKGYTISGAYGYIWNSGSPNSMMGSFFKAHGMVSTKRYDEDSAWSGFVTESNANNPYVMGTLMTSAGHVILALRANQACSTDGSSSWAKTGCLIVHDPYGNKNCPNGGTWKGNRNGRHATYQRSSANNGYASIGTLRYGWASHAPQTDPAITISPERLTMSCYTGGSVSKTVTITGTALSSGIWVGTDSDMLKVNGQKSTTIDAAGATVTITFNGTTAGSFKDLFFGVKCGDIYKKIYVDAQCIAPSLKTDKPTLNFDCLTGETPSSTITCTGVGLGGSKIWVGSSDPNVFTVNGGASVNLDSTGGTVTIGFKGSSTPGTYGPDGTLGKKRYFINFHYNDTYEVLVDVTASVYKQGITLSTNNLNFNCEQGDMPSAQVSAVGRGLNGHRIWVGSSDPNVFTVNGEASTYIPTEGGTVTIQFIGTTPGTYGPDGTAGKSDYYVNFFTDYGSDKVHLTATVTPGKPKIGVAHTSINFDEIKVGETDQANVNMVFFYLESEVECRLEGADAQMFDAYITDYVNATAVTRITYAPTAEGTHSATVVLSSKNADDVKIQLTGSAKGFAQIIKADTDRLTINGPVGKAKATIQFTGTALNTPIYVGSSDATRMTVNGAAYCNIPKEGGTVTVQYIGTTAGTFDDLQLNLYCEQAELHIPVTAIITEDGPSFDYDITANTDKIKTLWDYSVNGTTAPWTTFDKTASSNRDIALIGNKLYVLNGKNWGDVAINILDANTGVKTGELSTAGVISVTGKLGSITNADGRLIASNIVTDAQNLRIYIWDDDNATPRTLAAIDNPGITTGASIAFSGTLQDGRIWLTHTRGTYAVYLEVKNGTCDNVLHSIQLQDQTLNPITRSADDGRGASGIHVLSEDFFTVTSPGSTTEVFNRGGRRCTALPANAVGSNLLGTSCTAFTYGGKNYVASVTYKDASNAYGGQVAIAQLNTSSRFDFTSCDPAFVTIPAEGLAPNQTQYLNDQRASRVLARVEGTKLTIWFNVFAQGLACYQYNSDQTGIEDIMTDDADSDIEYYTIQGIRVHSDNLTPGLYIRRQGNKATKVLIR